MHKPFNSFKLVRVKDKTENLKNVGETSRLLETRVKKHLSRNSSTVHEHCQLRSHSVDFRKTKVPEAIEITLRKPSLNRDSGFELASIYDTILSPSGLFMI